MEITEKIIENFNAIMAVHNSVVRIRREYQPGTSIEIVVQSDEFIDESMRHHIAPNTQFFNILEVYFKEHGIQLEYNNTKRIFWQVFY